MKTEINILVLLTDKWVPNIRVWVWLWLNRLADVVNPNLGII
jgi:hypothetical protein